MGQPIAWKWACSITISHGIISRTALRLRTNYKLHAKLLQKGENWQQRSGGRILNYSLAVASCLHFLSAFPPLELKMYVCVLFWRGKERETFEVARKQAGKGLTLPSQPLLPSLKSMIKKLEPEAVQAAGSMWFLYHILLSVAFLPSVLIARHIYIKNKHKPGYSLGFIKDLSLFSPLETIHRLQLGPKHGNMLLDSLRGLCFNHLHDGKTH